MALAAPQARLVVRHSLLSESQQVRGTEVRVMGEPEGDEEYDRDVYIEVLSDWGWFGSDSERPVWLSSGDPESA